MFQNNKVNVVISIVVAIVLWSYVFFEINPTQNVTISEVPVKIIGVEELQKRDLTIVGNEEYTVDVKIRGPRSDITQVAAGDIEATADVANFTKGRNDIKVMVRVPDNVTREEVKPSTISVKVEEYVTSERPVRIEYEGTFSENTEPGFDSVSTSNIEISGASSQVKKVSYIKALVNSDDVKNEEQVIKTKVIPVDKSGNEISNIDLSQQTVDVTTTLCHIKTVPLEVPVKGKVDSDYEVSSQKIPETVEIKGIKSQLDKINKIKAKSININNIKKSTEIPIEIDLPEKVELTDKSKDLKAVIEISGATISDLSYKGSDIRIDNADENYSVVISEDEIKASVYANDKTIASFKKSDFVLYVDLKDADYTQNVYIAEIKYSVQKKVDNVNISPAQVQVKITEKEKG